MKTASNFNFLKDIEPTIFRLGRLAERYFHDDPNTCLVKLRQQAELIANFSASRFALKATPADKFADVLRRLKLEASLPREVSDLFHTVRLLGNKATHQPHESPGMSRAMLK